MSTTHDRGVDLGLGGETGGWNAPRQLVFTDSPSCTAVQHTTTERPRTMPDQEVCSCFPPFHRHHVLRVCPYIGKLLSVCEPLFFAPCSPPPKRGESALDSSLATARLPQQPRSWTADPDAAGTARGAKSLHSALSGVATSVDSSSPTGDDVGGTAHARP